MHNMMTPLVAVTGNSNYQRINDGRIGPTRTTPLQTIRLLHLGPSGAAAAYQQAGLLPHLYLGQ